MLNFFSESFFSESQSLLFCNLWGLSGLGEGGGKKIVTLCPCLVRAVWGLGGGGNSKGRAGCLQILPLQGGYVEKKSTQTGIRRKETCILPTCLLGNLSRPFLLCA